VLVREQEKQRLESKLVGLKSRKSRNRALWPDPATLSDNAERSADARDPRGYRWKAAMRDLLLRAQIVPKAVWNELFVGFGFPSRNTKKALFYGVLQGEGIGPDVFDGRPEHLEGLLASSLGEDIGCRCILSIDAISVTASMSVDLENGVLPGGV
jgi:hypothetical protein